MRSLSVLVISLFVVVVLGWLAGRAAPRPIADLVEAVNGGDAAAAARMLDDPLRWFTWPTAAWGRPLATKSAVSDVFAFHAATGGSVEVVDCRREAQPSVKGLDETHRPIDLLSGRGIDNCNRLGLYLRKSVGQLHAKPNERDCWHRNEGYRHNYRNPLPHLATIPHCSIRSR